MNCPVCQKTLAPTLSICFSCGTMVHDTVREELEIKAGSASKRSTTANQVSTERKEVSTMTARSDQSKFVNPSLRAENLSLKIENTPVNIESSPEPAPAQSQTGEISVRPTSPTLVDFQNKNVSVPDWRLKIQNAVQQRKGGAATAVAVAQTEQAPAPRTRLVTSG